MTEENESPTEIKLSNGSYFLFDVKEGIYRVAFYERRVSRSADLKSAVARSMKKPEWDSKVKEIVEFIEGKLNAAVSA